MSDYGGVIGGAVGAIIGGWATGWVNPQGYQWGWAIGSAIGGAYATSQQVIPGPKIGDVQKQTSQEGGFRPFVYGRSVPISGNVIADGGPRIVTKRESQGKGGPKVESESAFRTYAVGFCEGETTLLQAWRYGILVYDAEDPSMAAENAKFLEYAKWYSGSFDQMADPELEGIYGVGNTPFFRGTSYLRLSSEDVTDARGAWSQWQVRVFRGAAKSYTTPPYPIEYTENLGVSTQLVGMTLRDIYQSADEIEHLSVMPSLQGMTLRLVIQSLDAPTEHLATSASLQGMTLRYAMQSLDAPTEHLATSASLQGMTLRAARIDANPGTEHLSVSPSLQGMSLYEP